MDITLLLKETWKYVYSYIFDNQIHQKLRGEYIHCWNEIEGFLYAIKYSKFNKILKIIFHKNVKWEKKKKSKFMQNKFLA